MTVVNQQEFVSISEPVALVPHLTKGWVETTLDQLLQILESGSRPKGGVRGIKEGIPSIGGEHLDDNGGFRFQTIKFVPHRFFERMNRGRIQTGDILIVKDGATTGKVALARDDFPYNPAVVNEHVFICRPAVGVYPPFLFYFLFSKEGQDRILENFRGSAQGGINQSFAPGTAVPFAPLAEQKRIVAKLEQLLARVNAARERLAKVPAILKRFRQSVLASACSGRLTADWRDTHQEIKPASKLLEQIISRSPQRRSARLTNGVRINDDLPETWTHCRLGLLSKLITKGASPKWQGIDYASKGILFITSENVRSGYLNLENRKYVEKRFNAIQKRSILEKGDLLTNIVGASIGRTAIFDLDDVANINQAVALIRLCSDVDKRYILNVLNAPMILDFMNENKVDVARANLSLKDVLNFPVPLPPMAEQREIVHRTEGLFQIAAQIEARYERATAYVEKLTQSILAKAFRGELVPTEAELAHCEGRSYEPASALLAKIEAQRKDVKPPRKRGRSRQRRNK